MDPATVERLKREWTNRRVEVVGTPAALRRFQGRAGTVVTVNMNGRALVRFDGPADIGWYDLGLADLRVIEPAPAVEDPKLPGQPPLTSTTRPAPVLVEATKGAVAAPEKPLSVLELARRQGAAKRPGDSA